MRKLFLILMTVIACTWSLSAQTRTYHGTVLDAANNEPLIGATVMPIGGGQGAAADLDGNFTLTVPQNVKQATVSYVGYKSKTVALADKMTVYLESSSTSLDDVVVVAYGTANKESLTGSVAVVGSKEIEERPVTTTTAALEGNAPGVQVNNTVGTPGAEPTIRIRGFNSINGSNNPLYVVDGVPYDGSLSDINPADVESMTVLKDAASAALYGNRGANGVILITTKRAKNVGKVDVTLRIGQGFYERGLPEYDRLGANEWMQYAFNGYVNANVSSNPSQSYSDVLAAAVNGGFMSAYAANNIYGVPDNQLFTAEGKFAPYRVLDNGEIERVYNPLSGYNDLDWWKSISQTGYRQEYTVNAAAATDKFNVFASIGYLKENGYVLQTDFERFNARINANFNPTSYLRFGVNLHATHYGSEQSSVDPDNLSLVTNPFLTMFTAPIYPYYKHNEDGSIVRDAEGNKVWNVAGYLSSNNIAYSMREDKNNYRALVVDGNIYGTAVLPYGFEVTVRGAMHRDKTHGNEYSSNKIGSSMGHGSLSRTFQGIHSHTFMQQLNWSHEYGAHHVDVLLDHENYEVYSESTSATKSEQAFPGIYHFSNFSDMQFLSGAATKERSESYLGRVRYNYEQKYNAEFSIRRDGTSKFYKDNRWGTFWSVGANWVITKEKFMQNIDWVDFLKLRAAYGSVGQNASAAAQAYLALYYNNIDIDNLGTIIPYQLAANNVKWEATKTFDIALDGTLFNNRLNFSIGYFNKRNTDLLFNVAQASSVGGVRNNGVLATVLTNIGTMQNIGWELSFNGDVIRTQDWTWGLSLDMTFLKNKILKLPENNRDILGNSSAYSVGRSLYEYYLYKWAGVDQMTGNSLYEINPTSRDFYVYNEDGSGYYSTDLFNERLENARSSGALVEYNGKYYTNKTSYASREFVGSSLPTVYGSFGTTLSWKGIHLAALFTYSLGGKTLDTNYASLMSFGNSAGALHEDVKGSWTQAPEGMTVDSPNRIDPNGIPQINSYTSSDNNASSSRFLTSSNYLVFKNLNISYDFPKKWVNALQMQNLNLGFSVDNLFTATKRKGMNPQYSFAGGQGAYFVTARVFSFALTAKF